MFWFLKEVLQSMGWFTIEELQYETYSEMKLFHNYNHKWSLFLRSCMLSLYREIHEEPEITITERLVKLRLVKEPQSLYKGYELLN
jgi:hypothetical protein